MPLTELVKLIKLRKQASGWKLLPSDFGEPTLWKVINPPKVTKPQDLPNPMSKKLFRIASSKYAAKVLDNDGTTQKDFEDFLSVLALRHK